MSRLLQITDLGNGIKVQGTDNIYFPDNATLTYPYNSVIAVIDDSDIVTFRSASNNDVLFSGLIGNLQIGGTTVTKQNVLSTFDSIANQPTGGGGDMSNYYTKDEVDDLIPEDVSELVNDVGYITQEQVVMNESFPSSWLQAQDMEDLITAINNDEDAVVGKSYMDTISLSDLPAGMQQAEVKAEIMSELGQGEPKVILFTVTSSNTSPYHWEYTSAYGATGTWRQWATSTEIADFFDGAEYDSQTKRINFKHGNTIKTYIDATAFIKDGMVDTVAISNGNLVITFNTDAGKQPISIPLTDIFNPANYYDKTATDNLLAAKADASSLATVATSGSYNDLSNKPTIPSAQVNSDWNAVSGVAQILNKPTNVSAFTNDAGYLTQHQSLAEYYTKTQSDARYVAQSEFDTKEEVISAALNDLDTNKQDTLVAGTNISIQGNVISASGSAAQIQSDWNQSDPNSVDYIKNKPTIPSAQVNSDWNANSGVAQILNKPTNVSTFTNDAGYLTQHQSLSNYYTKSEVDAELALKEDASSAFSGDYNDLTNKPVIPTVPTNVSAFTNDAGYATETWVGQQGYLTTQTQADWNQSNSSAVDFIKNKPTNVSTFTNDAGYLTQHQSLAEYYTKTQSDGRYVAQSEFDVKEEVIATALNDLEANKQDTLTAGTNITIENNVISATGGGATQVQSDWNQSDSSAVDYIKNKPTIPDTSNFITKTEYNPKEIAIANALTQLNENKADKSQIPSTSGFEQTSNKVTSLSSSSTDTQYPSAKCVYDIVGNIESLLQAI